MKRCESVSLLSGRGSGYGAFMMQHMPESVASAEALNGQAYKTHPWSIYMDAPMIRWHTCPVDSTGHGKTFSGTFLTSQVMSSATGDRHWMSFGNASCLFLTPSEDSHAR
ncbi:hypothetical protein ACTUSQ_23125 [Pantoea ananatis]|uniref:hypothetical protein n=1 Tax=Pantoea ananas TaxID=553 RepID=UPI0004970B04|nr:hypothetical protein HA38_11835 [Pantoea allii]PBK00726.1 hypothetical protein CMR03_08290 [Pantoea allii]